MLKQKIVYRRIDELIPHPANPRMHPEKQIQELMRSVSEFGLLGPVLIDQENLVIAGNARLEVARRLGMKTVPTISVEHLSDEVTVGMRIAAHPPRRSGRGR